MVVMLRTPTLYLLTPFHLIKKSTSSNKCLALFACLSLLDEHFLGPFFTESRDSSMSRR